MSAAPKRPLFNKPAWSNPSKIGGADELFHRSSQTYLKIAAEAEERRKKKIARLKQERDNEQSLEGRPGKRRCVSDDSDDGDDTSSNEEKADHPAKEKVHLSRTHASIDRETGPSVPVQPRNIGEALPKQPDKLLEDSKLELEKTKTSYASSVIDLEDDISQSQIAQDDEIKITIPKISKPAEDDGLPLSDEEFPELARKAREKARKKRTEADSVSNTQDSSRAPQNDLERPFSQGLHKNTPECPPPDPVIQILLTSLIPNTDPLIVSRKLSQRLREVRLAWCERQGFSPEFIPTVFLTWKGNRLFDVTTCKSLGITIDADGDILLKGRKDIMGEEDRHIHMEATTEEIVTEQQRSKRSNLAETGEEDEVEEAVPLVQEEAQLRIILKAKGHADFKLIVKPSTLISRIVNAFRSDKKIGGEKEVFLSFDGERLEGQSKVGETELNDMDYIDVYVK